MRHNEYIAERIGVLKTLNIWWWVAGVILLLSALVAFIFGVWVTGACSLLWSGTCALQIKTNREQIKDYELQLAITKEDLDHATKLQKGLEELQERMSEVRKIIIQPKSGSIHDETDVFEHVSSGIGPDDEKVVEKVVRKGGEE